MIEENTLENKIKYTSESKELITKDLSEDLADDTFLLSKTTAPGEDKVLNFSKSPQSGIESELAKLIDKYSFDWDMVDVIIGGKSSIDLSRLAITSLEDADVFMKIYGYDLSLEPIKEEVKNIYSEAINFIEDFLIPDPFTRESLLQIPEEIKNEEDIRKLLILASDHSNKDQPWACAILRVMHTISHVNNDISLKFFPEIQRQILDRIWSSIYINPKGEKFFGKDETGIKLYDVEIKAKKERGSTILKLIHKIENVAADVFDKIGIRIITYNKVDALLIIRFLRKNGILDFPNVKPTRSINRLMDLKVFKKILNHYKDKLVAGEITSEEFEALIRQDSEKEAALAEGDAGNAVNPYSSNEYRSIQFTCRQMIRMKTPTGSYVNDNEAYNFTFFFPYEMQLVDIQTHIENHFGKASHDKYKEKQLINARRRVLGKLLRDMQLKKKDSPE